MNEWESNWAGYLAEETGSANVEFTARALQLWQRSTPLEPWTNNPLGMPRTAKGAHQALSTEYGAFMSMAAFRTAFLGFLASTPGRKLRDALLLQEKLAPVWRAIHDLRWPASLTETDYPSAILDEVEQSYRTKVKALPPLERKTAGSFGPQVVSSRPFEAGIQQRIDLMGDISVLMGTGRLFTER